MQRIRAYRGSGDYIFISYSHKDTERVMEILSYLERQNIRFWYDDGIDPGEEWDENIASHIDHCSGFIAFMSGNYIASTNCKDELNYARDLEKERLLIYLEETTLPSGMAMRLNRLQAIHKYKYIDDESFHQKLMSAPIVSAHRSLFSNSVFGLKFFQNAVPEKFALRQITKEGNFDGYAHIMAQKQYSITKKGTGVVASTYTAYHPILEKTIEIKEYSHHRVLSLSDQSGFSIERIAKNDSRLCEYYWILDEFSSYRCYYAMEYVKGTLLKQYIESIPITSKTVLRIIIKILQKLLILHSQRICYGNVTEYTVKITDDEIVFLCDYGCTCRYTVNPVEDAFFLFSPTKEKIQQLSGCQGLDHRTDLFDIGILLNKLTFQLEELQSFPITVHYNSGENESLETDLDSIKRIQQPYFINPEAGLYPKPYTSLSDKDEKIYAVITKATKLLPDKRYQSASDMIEDIEAILRDYD